MYLFCRFEQPNMERNEDDFITQTEPDGVMLQMRDMCAVERTKVSEGVRLIGREP